MTDRMNWLQAQLGLDPTIQVRLLYSLLGVIGLWLGRRMLLWLVLREESDLRRRYVWHKTSSYFLYGLVVVFLGLLWLRNLASLATYLGLLSAGLAIALRDPVTNLVGWVFILWRRPFEVGDRIQVGEHAGDVIDLRLFQFTLLEIGNWVAADQSTGRVIHLPNGKVFTEPLANYTKGMRYIWNEIPVLVTFESDWRAAKAILGDIGRQQSGHLSHEAEESVRQAARKFMISYSALTPIVYTSVAESGVLLTLRYLCEPQQRRGSAHAIWEQILDAFAEHADIEFAYPTVRFYDAAGDPVQH